MVLGGEKRSAGFVGGVVWMVGWPGMATRVGQGGVPARTARGVAGGKFRMRLVIAAAGFGVAIGGGSIWLGLIWTGFLWEGGVKGGSTRRVG